MSRKPLIVGGVVVAGLAALSVYLYARLDRAERDLTASNQEIEDLKKGREASQTQTAVRVAEFETMINGLQEKVRDYDRTKDDNKRLDDAVAESRKLLEAERKKSADAAAQIEVLRGERDRASQRLEAQLKIHADLVPELEGAKHKAEKAGKDLEQALKEKAAVVEKLAVAEAEAKKRAVEVEKLRSLAPELAGSRIVGKVEEKIEPGKIILSELSAKPEVGLELSVFREAEFVARVRVYRVFEKYAGARITFLQKGKDVRVGDEVKTGF